jgi:ubiquinone/menaquinone biosynthesis C-methylase UbiE
MKKLKTYFTPLHRRTQRNYIARMMDDKVHCMLKAKMYGADYWDGDRRYGYGGYKYDGRWKAVAEQLITDYNLTNASKLLDVGCGKAHLIHEIKLLLPQIAVVGLDISTHAIAEAPEAIRAYLSVHRAQDPLPFGDKEFDLVISLGCLHNLRIYDLKAALAEIERVGKQGYFMVESYRNEQELFNLQCWALTCESFFEPTEWVWVMNLAGYTGDYEFIYFE